jgi:hypothetical protein
MQSLCLPLIALLVACSGTHSVSYDRDARETLGRITAKRVHIVVNRETNPSAMSADTMGALYGAIGAVVVNARAKRADVPIYLYTIGLDEGRVIQVVSEWATFEPSQCVVVFESNSGRSDYPRIAAGSGCSPAH